MGKFIADLIAALHLIIFIFFIGVAILLAIDTNFIFRDLYIFTIYSGILTLLLLILFKGCFLTIVEKNLRIKFNIENYYDSSFTLKLIMKVFHTNKKNAIFIRNAGIGLIIIDILYATIRYTN